MKEIDTRLVYGFLDAGKTNYIKEIIRDDRFYKYGSTLIICFEKGEEKYDEEALAEKRAKVVYYDRKSDITGFCMKSIEENHPDRIYVEMNTMIPELRELLPDCMRVTFAAALIDWSTLPVYYTNFLQMMKQMVSESNQVTFRDCPSSDLLAPYSQSFRLMNPKASYLRRDPMGYHEKAFGLFLPFSKTARLRSQQALIFRSGWMLLITRNITKGKAYISQIRLSFEDQKRVAHGAAAES